MGRSFRQVDLGDAKLGQRLHGRGAVGIGDQHFEFGKFRIRRGQLANYAQVSNWRQQTTLAQCFRFLTIHGLPHLQILHFPHQNRNR